MEERRKYVRLEKALSLTFERKGPTETLRGEGVTKNISPTGLCFTAKASFGVGEKMAGALFLPSRSLSFEARVKWTHPLPKAATSFETGIEFSSMAMTDQNKYLLFICDLMCEQLKRQVL